MFNVKKRNHYDGQSTNVYHACVNGRASAIQHIINDERINWDDKGERYDNCVNSCIFHINTFELPPAHLPVDP